MTDPGMLFRRYQEQLQQTGTMLRERAVNFRQVAESTFNEYKAQLDNQREQMQIQPTMDAYKAAIRDFDSPVPSNASPFLVKTYLWASICVFGFAVSRILSGMFLHGIVFAIFDTWTALLLTYVALPVYVYLILRKVQMGEVEREQVVLFGAVAEGILVGALFFNRYATISHPLISVPPLVLGLLAHYAGAKEQVAGNRRVFLGALLGGVVAAHVVLGFVFNFNFDYLMAVAIIDSIAFVDLQQKLAGIQSGDASTQLEQWKTVVFMTLAFTVAHFLTSGPKEDGAAAADLKKLL